jgi:ABC-type amino acid transport system permease subunit
MTDRIADFWAALGAMTFAETLEVAETMRAAWESTVSGEFEATDVSEWSFLLNAAREIAEDRAGDAA